MIHIQTLTEPLTRLLQQAGYHPRILAIDPCEKGKNNRTYRVETTDGLFAVKHYFQQAQDTRNRLAAEFAFLTYANHIVPKQVPTPFSYDAEEGMALYEFIEGESFHSDPPTETDINQAIQFFCALNEPTAKLAAIALPTASEACFSLQDHLDLIDVRLQQLRNTSPLSPQDRQAQEAIARIITAWDAYRNKLQNRNDLAQPLALAQRCLSPSDFGFHNALRKPDGTICFLDFEYAGWDDPAKMTGDFFAQLAVPVPSPYFDNFVRKSMAMFPDAEALIERAYLLRYVYLVKWCCIALNIFIPIHLTRRQFSNPNLDVTVIKTTQLEKVARLITLLEHFA